MAETVHHELRVRGFHGWERSGHLIQQVTELRPRRTRRELLSDGIPLRAAYLQLEGWHSDDPAQHTIGRVLPVAEDIGITHDDHLTTEVHEGFSCKGGPCVALCEGLHDHDAGAVACD